MNTAKSYNGWRNRATWNVHLWLSNDEPLYRQACDVVRGPGGIKAAAERLRDLCFDLWPSRETPDGDSLHAVSLSGWRDIAAAFRE